MTGWPNWDFSFEKHVVEIKKDFYAEVDWDIDIRADVELDVYKDIDVYVDSDVDLEGNVAIGEVDIEDTTNNDLISAQFAELTVLGTSSVAQMEVETEDYTITTIASAETSHFLPAVTLAEFSTNALITDDSFTLTHVGESAVDIAFG